MNLSIGERLANRIKVTPPVRLIVVSFLIVIALGTFLLCLPVSLAEPYFYPSPRCVVCCHLCYLCDRPYAF